MARLIIFEEQANDTIFEVFSLEENRVIIGSDRDNQLILDVPDIDPMHASLELRDSHWCLQDLGGPGGTSINGQQIEGPQMLHHNDIIEVGPIKMQFKSDEQGESQEVWRRTVNASDDVEADPDGVQHEVQLSGRVWFAGLAMATLIIIFAIFMLFVAAHLLGVINLQDLLPVIFGGT